MPMDRQARVGNRADFQQGEIGDRTFESKWAPLPEILRYVRWSGRNVDALQTPQADQRGIVKLERLCPFNFQIHIVGRHCL
jgi:hypothetical protein